MNYTYKYHSKANYKWSIPDPAVHLRQGFTQQPIRVPPQLLFGKIVQGKRSRRKENLAWSGLASQTLHCHYKPAELSKSRDKKGKCTPGSRTFSWKKLQKQNTSLNQKHNSYNRRKQQSRKQTTTNKAKGHQDYAQVIGSVRNTTDPRQTSSRLQRKQVQVYKRENALNPDKAKDRTIRRSNPKRQDDPDRHLGPTPWEES